MSEDSESIISKMKYLLEKVDRMDIITTYGFVRTMVKNDKIPDEIINYCVVYAFLKLNEWREGGSYFNIKSKYLAEAAEFTQTGATTVTVYGNPVISKGKHDWKVKITQKGPSMSMYNYIGIADDNMHCINAHFFGQYAPSADKGAKNYAYVNFNGRMNHSMNGSQNWIKCMFKSGDTISVHLDLQ